MNAQELGSVRRVSHAEGPAVAARARSPRFFRSQLVFSTFAPDAVRVRRADVDVSYAASRRALTRRTSSIFCAADQAGLPSRSRFVPPHVARARRRSPRRGLRARRRRQGRHDLAPGHLRAHSIIRHTRSLHPIYAALEGARGVPAPLSRRGPTRQRQGSRAASWKKRVGKGKDGLPRRRLRTSRGCSTHGRQPVGPKDRARRAHLRPGARESFPRPAGVGVIEPRRPCGLPALARAALEGSSRITFGPQRESHRRPARCVRPTTARRQIRRHAVSDGGTWGRLIDRAGARPSSCSRRTNPHVGGRGANPASKAASRTSLRGPARRGREGAPSTPANFADLMRPTRVD